MNSTNNFNMFIDLDSLLDTRFSLIHSLNPDIIKAMFKSEEYQYRITDQFGYLDADTFKYIYNRRNKHILKDAPPTKMMKTITELTMNSLHQGLVVGNSLTKVYLNIYPYKLTEDEMDNIRLGLLSKTFSDVDVEIVNMSYDEITPVWVKDNVKTVIMYEGNRWLANLHYNGMIHVGVMSDIQLIIPTILDKHPQIDSKEYEKFFKDLEEQMKHVIKIFYSSTDEFNINLEKKKEDG